MARIRRGLAIHDRFDAPCGVGDREAAVAIVLAGHDDGLNMCFVRRAQYDDDPWSGHVAFPGGKKASKDASEWAVAEREAVEEIGLSMHETSRVGMVSDLTVRLAGRENSLIITPCVYFVGRNFPALRVGPEVESAFWMPLAELWNPDEATCKTFDARRTQLVYPAIRCPSGPIWGITFRILSMFSDIISRPLPHLEDIPGLGQRG